MTMAILRRPTSNAWVITLVLCLICLPGCYAKLSDLFDDFFPQYNAGFQDIIRRNCSSEYQTYLVTDSDTDLPLSDDVAFGDLGAANLVVNCILRSTPEVVKTKLASSQILLGLAPSILAAVGIRPQDSAILAILGRKPLLAGLLALGSPAVLPLRASEYALAISDLHEPGLRLLQFKSHLMRNLLDAVIYILGAASVANVVELTWEIADKLPFAISPDQWYLAFLWTFLGMIIHVLAAFALWFKVEVQLTKTPEDESLMAPKPEESHVEAPPKRTESKLSSIKQALTWGEFGHNGRLRVMILPGSLRFYAASWLTSIFTACHIIFGTLIFASALFISINDSLMIIGRLLGSAIASRLLLKVEIVLLQSRIEVARKEVA